MVKRLHLLLFFLVCLVFLQEIGYAQSSKITIRKLGVNWNKRVPSLSFSATDFANDDVHRRLRSGLPQTIITRIYAYSENGYRPLAISVLSCRVIYDLWHDLYRVQVKTERMSYQKSLLLKEDVQRACLMFSKFPLGMPNDYDRVHRKKIYFAVVVELNPISDKTVEQIKRWLARSDERNQLTSGAFFGSFVSIFVDRRIGSAEHSLSFRSPLYRVP